MSARRRRRGDDGSIILSLLAIVMVTALLVVVAATVVAGQRQTRVDQTFEQALQVGEVGLSQMTSLIQSAPSGGSFPSLSGTTSDGGSYTVNAVKNGYVWTVTATGTNSRGTARTLQNDVTARPLFNAAAFGRSSATFAGGNGADSFDSALGTGICLYGSMGQYANPGTPTNASTTDSDVYMCNPTRLGSVATNGELFLKGDVAGRIDLADIYNAKDHVSDPLPGSTGTCIGVTATCDLYSTGKLRYTREALELPPINVCNLSGTPVDFTGTGSFGSRAYNLRDVTLTGDSVFTGTVASPTVLCVSGRLTIAQQQLVNFQQVAGRWVPRRPGSLLIFVTGTSSSGISMGDHASVAAALYAPNAAVDCGPQGNVYGSLVANSINNAGGWNFHYDDSLRDQMANAAVRVSNWAELH